MVAFTTNTNNGRVHGDPVPNFVESLALVLGEGSKEQESVARLTVISAVI
jgi:hypothetical protein